MAVRNEKTIDYISYLIFSLGLSIEKQMIELPIYCLNWVSLVSVLQVTEELIQDSSSTFRAFPY